MSARSFPIEIEIGSVQRATPRFIVPDWMLEEDEAFYQALRAALIAARAGTVEHQGQRYALTWDEGA